jgi:uncharacterized protein YdeI (YjbR/CyaY-like superfamily)
MKDKKIWNRNQKWLEEIELLKSIIEKTELVETVKWGGIVYTWNNRNIIGIGGFKDYFTIWFFNGVFLSDEKKYWSIPVKVLRKDYANGDLLRKRK